MKRIALTLAAFALTGAMAFADDAAPATPAPVQVTIGDWGRQVLGIGNQDNSGYYAGLGTSWGSSPRIVGLNIQATYAYGGFSITPSADNGTFSLTDQNKAWITPLPGLTFESGITLETDTWRGTSDFGSDDWIRLQGYQQNSFTFFRLGEGGYLTDVNYNKDGIGFWAGLSGTGSSGQAAATDLGSALQAGAAYTIPSGPQIKAQYIGYAVNGTTLQGTTRTGVADGTPFGQIQVAANLQKIIPGLNQEIGVDIPTNGSDAGYVFQASDITDFTIQQTTLHLLALVTDFNGNLTGSGGSGYGLLGGVGADYDFGNKVTLNTDIRYGNALGSSGGASTTNVPALAGGLIGISKGFDHGLIGVGFEYSTAGIAGGNSTNVTSNNSVGHWVIPVRLEESF